ncbi:MAG: hypothetical protein HY360_16205 [Verrucomicrobia bacterium]|nr:hypothetical protein [Verrucomicrobiota bacterium]
MSGVLELGPARHRLDKLRVRVNTEIMIEVTPPEKIERAKKIAAADRFKATVIAGKHVFPEKPVGSNLAEILQLKQAADAKPRLKIQIGFEFQSSPFAQEIKRVIDAGQLGRATFDRDRRNGHSR